MTDAIELLPEQGRRSGRDVRYSAGTWEQIQGLIPTFEVADFCAATGEPANPFLRAVIRKPVTPMERPIPVGAVSKSYSLVQHHAVGSLCLSGMRNAGVDVTGARCELGLSNLGEWMHLRIYFPDEYSFMPPDQNKLALRLEAFNSVDGSSRLTILLSWLRLVCLNGMVINESITEIHDVHNQTLSLDKIEQAIVLGTLRVKEDMERLSVWQSQEVESECFETWVNEPLSERWGKKAACRVFHICTTGYDVEFADPFEGGPASEKSVRRLQPVPGTVVPSSNLYDISQALSWVASGRRDPEERIAWQSEMPKLLKVLARDSRQAFFA